MATNADLDRSPTGEALPPVSPKPTVTVFGEIYSNNLGDGILFECLSSMLAQRGFNVHACDLSCRRGYKNNADSVVKEPGRLRRFARYFVRRNLFIRRSMTLIGWIAGDRNQFRKAFLSAIRDSDAVILGAGQLLTDRQWRFPLRVLTIVNLARRHRKPFGIVGCGADTHQGRFPRLVLKIALTYASYVSVRDYASAAYLATLCERHIDVIPDIGFVSSRAFDLRGRRRRKVLGINVMDHSRLLQFCPRGYVFDQSSSYTFWHQLVQRALAAGWAVNFMTNGDPIDHGAAKSLYEAFAQDDRVTLCRRPEEPRELVSQINSVDALVACRMHAGIVGYSLGKAVAPMSWDTKVLHVWKRAVPSLKVFSYYEAGAAMIADLEFATLTGTYPQPTLASELMSEIDRSIERLSAALNFPAMA